ncbi:uncharacterized protein I303_100184 [Kwoniella dejecticola CBS 10117]|uniref:HIG1 domain-containing protein n=1 Tax=Kwoniella dejecticola CBS 10117 TaxID=1296121 RepID=A0A1A6AE68_9TREE|nr:uncharacterized protein I303_00186 [Kwoniella dejecticola CBS 10117]OBR88371.1 hypothetical protein I303_00186 [Kwoniella dejecticola CBS 10117]
MKLATAEDIQAYNDATINGGIRGLFYGIGLSVPGFYLLNKRLAAYRALPTPLKAAGYVMVIVPCISIAAEKQGEAFTRSQYSGVAKLELDKEAQLEDQRWQALSSAQKFGDWAGRHKYQLVGASWVGSLLGAWALVNRNKHQTTSQKVVQARMWAQGLTVGLLMASALLTGFDSSKSEEPRAPHEDHTWKAILDADPHLNPEERKRLHEIRQAVTDRKDQLVKEKDASPTSAVPTKKE